MATKPQTLEKRTRAAALRSLGLIGDLLARHRAALEAGEVPDAGFTASVTKYEESRAILTALAKLSDAAAGEEPVSEMADYEVAVSQQDLEILVDALNEFVPPELLASNPGAPYYNIVTALGGAPVPDGAPDGS